MRQYGRSARAERGVTLIGMLFWAVLVGFGGYLVIKAVPAVLEYRAIQGAVDRIAASPPATVAEIRAAFDRQKDIEYSIESISGRDLEITKESNRVVIGFAYEKEVELVAPVYLLLKFQGRSR